MHWKMMRGKVVQHACGKAATTEQQCIRMLL